MRTARTSRVATAALLLMAACAGAGGTGSATLVSMELAPSSVALTMGSAQQLTASGVYSDGSSQDLTTLATWVSASPSVAAMGAAGLLVGVSVGRTTVTATVGTVTGTADVVVSAPLLTGLAVTPPSVSLPPGRAQQLAARATYSDATIRDVTSQATWASGAPGNVTVSSAGLATAVTGSVAGSTAVITATFGGMTGTSTVTVGAALPGLEARPPNTTCIAPPRGGAAAGIRVARVFPGVSFGGPVLLLQAPGDASRWYVVEQVGRIRAFAAVPGVAVADTVVDISARVASGGELGLLGLAFHPDWPRTPEAFLSYTRSAPGLQSVISRFRSPDGRTLDPASEQVVLTVDQPFSNHNGGSVLFGPDGMLYVGLGDGGSGGDPLNNAQTLTTLLGKMLRIDVRGTGPGYIVPPGNPFSGNPPCPAGAGAQACPEIWAFGFRNPWRWSFDRGTGELWVGDVGQGAWEEVDRVVRGGNYGWRLREGTHCYSPSMGCPSPGTVVNGSIIVDPVTEYDHGPSGGQAITGGYVYRGTAVPALRGLYVFGDFSSGRIWTHEPGAPGLQRTEVAAIGASIAAFAEDEAGELYVLDYGSGGILRIEAAPGGGTDAIPVLLADTGCVDPAHPTRPATGLIPYGPSAPFWSDGATKERWIALPEGQAITATATGDWEFPVGTVLVKSFALGGKLVETRLFMRHPDGAWAGYTYGWNDAQTGATRVMGGATRLVGSQTWIYPSEQQCLQCHTAAAGRSLGLETAQLNGDFTYPQTGRTANQVMTLGAIGALVPPLPGAPASLPAFPDPYGVSGTRSERARAWLHTNCSSCHRPGGPTPTNLDFRANSGLSSTQACEALPQQGDLGIASARIIAPGDPARSVLLERIRSTGTPRMPPVGSNVVDEAGSQLISDWIQQLTGCQ